jgi:hypothetical protein
MGTRSTRLAALSGVVFIACLVPAVLVTGSPPSTNASATKVQSYYLAHKDKYGLASLLTVLAILFGLFFYGYLRAYFRKHLGMEWLSSIFFGGAILFAVSGAVGAGIDAVAADHPAALSASSLQLVNALESNLNWPISAAGQALLYLTAGFIIYKSKALPGWLAWASWVLGLASASMFLAFVGLIAMAPWVVIISVMLAMRNPSLTPGEPASQVVAPSVAPMSA